MILVRWKRAAAVALGFSVLLGLANLPVLQGKVVAGIDAFQLAIPDTTFLLDSWQRGEWPLWTPYERLGQPFAGQLQTQVFYPVRWAAALIGGPIWGVELERLFHALLACFGTYLGCRALGRSRLASFLGGASFGAGPMYVELGQIPNMAGAAGWSGVMVAAACHLDQKRSWRAGALLTLAAAGSLLNGSPETWLWQAMLVVLITRPGRVVRKLAQKGLALAASFALSGVALLPTLELLRESVRVARVPDQFLWSSPPATVLALFWLNADLPRPDSDQPLLACVFLGTCICLLALLSLPRRGMGRRLFALGAVLAILSLGDWFWPSHFLLSVPPFSFFRYPVKYLVGAQLCFSLAAARGLDVMRAWLRRMPPGWSWGWAGAAVGALVVAGGALLALRTVLPVREGSGEGLVWTIGVGTAGVAILLVPWRKARPAKVATMILLLACIEHAAVWTLWSGRIWVAATELSRPSLLRGTLPRPFEARIQVDVNNDERTARWPMAETFISRSRDNVIPLRNVEEQVALADGYGPPEPRRWGVAYSRDERGFMDLAGVSQYFTAERAPYPDLEPFPVSLDAGLLRRFSAKSAFPRAFVVYRAQIASDEEALKALADDKRPLREVAFLAEGEPIDSHPLCTPTPPVWKEYQPRFLVLEADVCADAYLVVTDSHFPGWSASVDGKAVPILRADFLVRAIRLGSGKHRIEMRYQPASVMWGGGLTLLSLVGVGLALERRLLQSMFRRLDRRSSTDPSPSEEGS